jgi:hypothetical protein
MGILPCQDLEKGAGVINAFMTDESFFQQQATAEYGRENRGCGMPPAGHPTTPRG